MNLLKKLFTEQKTHDYTVRRWGHDYGITSVNGGTIGIYGWGHGISAGDYILLPNKEGTTRYRFDRVTYFANPPDMWTGLAVFSPRFITQKQ